MNMRILKKAAAVATAAALLAPGPVFAADAEVKAVFQGIEVSGDFALIKLSNPVQYNSFVTQVPPRLVVDLLDTKDGAPVAQAAGSGRILKRARSAQYRRHPRLITRVVLDLSKTAGYRMGAMSNGLGIRLVDGENPPASQSTAKPAARASAVTAASSAPAPASAPVAAAKPAVKIAPKPAAEVAAKPSVATPPPAPAAPAPVPASVPIAASAPAPVAVPVAAAPAEKSESAAATPEPSASDESASMDKDGDTTQSEPSTQILSPATDSRMAVEAPPPTLSEKLSPAAAFKRAGLQGRMHSELAAIAEYDDADKSKIELPSSVHVGVVGSGRIGGSIYQDLISRLPHDPVTLDFDGTDIRDVIKLLAAKSRVNIIYGPDVTGTLTLHLSNVPFNDAFRTILSMMQLTTSQTGSNVLRVITPAELTKQRSSGTTITKVIQLNYAKPEDVKKTVDAVRTAEGRLGNTSVDDKTNSVIVTETLEGMTATENLVGQLDQRPPQVLIDAKIVEVSANTLFDYGVQWSQAGAQPGQIAGQQGVNYFGSPVGYFSTTSNAPTGSFAPGPNGGIFPLGATGQGTGVQLPADNIFGALTLGRITNSYIINATLTAAAAEGKAKILSDPKVATLNNQAATINVTSQIPYVTSNVSPTAATVTETVNYVTTGITMTVTPTINADGRILLVIQPNVSQPSATAAANTQTGAPAIDTRNANTTVLVRDGETVVIGGLISDSVSDTISKVPFLGDIPVLGWLFKKKSQSRNRVELLIFVTARLMPD